MTNHIVTPLAVRRRCLEYASQNPSSLNEHAVGAAIGNLSQAIEQLTPDGQEATKRNRQLVQGFLFTPAHLPLAPFSATLLTPGQKLALVRWVGATPAGNGIWLPRSTFKAEANWILSLSLYLYMLTLRQSPPPALATLLAGYQVEAGVKEDRVEAGFWLQLALEQPGAILTKIYQDG